MAVKRFYNERPTFFDPVTGVLANGYRLFFYASGTSTKQNTYNSSTGLSANTNPIVLNSAGQPSVELWGTAGLTYKLLFTNPGTDDPPNTTLWSEDVVATVNDVSTTNIFIDTTYVPTFISTTSFTVPGDQTTELHEGRRLKFTVTSGTVYGYIATSVFTTLTTVTMLMDAGQTIDSGLSVVFKSLIPELNPAIPFQGTPATISGNTTLVLADFSWNNPISKITATAAITLPAASTVSLGKRRRFMSFTGTAVTLVPNGTDTIGGVASSYIFPSNGMVEIVSNGSTGWQLFSFLGLTGLSQNFFVNQYYATF